MDEYYYEIDALYCTKTYSGFNIGRLKDFNDIIKQNEVDRLTDCFGTDRKFISEIPKNSDDRFPPYMFIAWLSGDVPDREEENGEIFHGHQLFVIGFTDTLINLDSNIHRMGSKYFYEKAEGFFY